MQPGALATVKAVPAGAVAFIAHLFWFGRPARGR
ncbi:hypothetical protein MHPYR_740005 [uncultured Mycobacterium sp.]|uniref:Uncharacterized protein n=1 Tax=uncultured Mycobacterium sp. TaxID=171292 RepID=A0A1Y5PPM5_9MYCO|nr:hypothetical protein MHPYR_740005 [uncultured Mycobacterium sp.]